MKPNPSPSEQQTRLLILSDGKPGHVNQSIAFARHLGCAYDLCRVRFKSRLAKGVSYLADRFAVVSDKLYTVEEISGNYTAIVSAGSETYYANRALSHRLGCKSIAIMLPKGYRLGFDLIVAQQHDNPPAQENIISLPINLTYVEPRGLVVAEPGCRYVAIIVGGNSKQVSLDPEKIRRQLASIFALFPEHRFWLTTSRRTPAAIEAVCREFSFARAVYYSEERINPIPDYLQQSDYVFLTADSTSMISEAVSSGRAKIEILASSASVDGSDKFSRFFSCLRDAGCLHLFAGELGSAGKKIDLAGSFSEVRL